MLMLSFWFITLFLDVDSTTATKALAVGSVNASLGIKQFKAIFESNPEKQLVSESVKTMRWSFDMRKKRSVQVAFSRDQHNQSLFRIGSKLITRSCLFKLKPKTGS